jgi:hypothetical protein
MMAITDRSGEVRILVATALRKVALGQDFSFDISCDLMPGPNGKLAIAYTVVTSMDSPLLGQPSMFTINQIQSVTPTAEQVDLEMGNAVASLRDAATRVLSGGNGHAAKTLGGTR